MKQKIYTLGVISAIVLMTGTIFKVQHWPAAAILICTGTVLILAAFLPAALINHYKNNEGKQHKLLYIVIYITCFVVFTGMLFKILHWPFAGYIVLITVPFPFIVFLPVWLYVTSRIKNFDINNTIYILFLLTLQAVFYVMLALNVTREKIDNTLELTNKLSSLNIKVKSLSDLSDKSAVISSADEVLAQIDACRQLLFDKTGLTRSDINQGTFSYDHLESVDLPSYFLLASTDPSPAAKLKYAFINFTGELGKLPGSRDFSKKVQDLFELTEKPEYESAWEYRIFQANFLTWVLVELDEMENFVRVIKVTI